MFDFFRRRTAKELIEEAKENYTVPTTPVPEKPATVYYRIGVTNNNRVSLQMGYSEVTMNREGVESLIKQLSVFRDQLLVEEQECRDEE
jgi:hypothetical protein